jgi:hypothetical protein
VSDELPTRTTAGPGLTGLVLLAVVVLGLPQVWSELRAGAPGLGSVFFPLLLVAVGSLAVSRRPSR